MKTDIHPRYQECKVHCGCGNEFTTRATVKELRIEICNVCHPFYTGRQKFVDAAGRVDKFFKKYGNRAKPQQAASQQAASQKADAPQAGS